MNATQPIGGSPERRPAELSIREMLDLLTSGGCNSAAFLISMRDRIRVDPSGNWEVLSLLDQYYRRGKVPKELFREIRTAMAEFALGLHREEIPVLRPPPRPAPPSAAPAAAIVTAPAGPRDARPDLQKSTAPDAAREVRVGDVLRNRYRIVGVLGQGGMGTVYEADDNYRLDIPPSGQGLALKILHTSVTKRAELFSELRREFQYLQALAHPNIVRAFEFDRDGALAFFTMELLNGSLLSRVLIARNRLRLERPDAWAVVRDVGSAIVHAHSRNIVHGDINPQNIFITLRGEVRVLDFGASHALSTSGAAGEIKSASFATPGYVSCQVLEGERPDARDDIFALACVTYLLLTGQHPFTNRTATEARARGIKAKRPAKLHQRQWRALRAALQWDRERRPTDVAAWLRELDPRDTVPRLRPLAELADNTEPPRRRLGFSMAMAAAALVALLAAGFWVATHNRALSARLAGMVDQTSAIRSTSPDSTSATDDGFASPPPVTPSLQATSQHAQSSPAIDPPPVATTTVAAPAAATPVRLSVARPGVSQIELAADTVDVPPNEPAASVLVHRKGNVHSRIGFTWWTESGTAKPGTDFAPVLPHVEYFEEDQATVTLSIRLTQTLRVHDKSFYVVIDQPEQGATLGPRGLTMITLPGSQ